MGAERVHAALMRAAWWQYEVGEAVTVWMNTAGPLNNRQETYPYYRLPFCRGSKLELDHHHETLGEVLQGMELVSSGMDVAFRQQAAQRPLCTRTWTPADVRALRDAVERKYWFEAYIGARHCPRVRAAAALTWRRQMICPCAPPSAFPRRTRRIVFTSLRASI